MYVQLYLQAHHPANRDSGRPQSIRSMRGISEDLARRSGQPAMPGQRIGVLRSRRDRAC